MHVRISICLFLRVCMVVCIYMCVCVCVCVCEREYVSVWSKISTGIEGKWKDARNGDRGLGDLLNYIC